MKPPPRAWMTASTLCLMLPTDECVAQEVSEPIYDGLTCPKYALWDSNPDSWLAKEQKSWFRFGGRRLLLLNDEAWRCHPYTQALYRPCS